MKIRVAIALTVLGLSIQTGSAQAGESTYLRSKVSYDDLDLNSTAGNAELYRRVKVAATRLCEDFDGYNLFSRFILGQSFAECVNDVLEQAVTKIHVLAFSDYVTGHGEPMSARLSAP